VWPKYVRRGQLEDDIFAVLNHDGSPRYTRTARTSYQSIRALDYLGVGHPQVVTASIDGEIEVLGAEGEAVRTIDLYAAHQRYHEKHGRSNTRSPAGGYVMPFDVGLWRSQSNQPPGLIVSRYGWYSFIDHQGKLDGLLTAGGYVMPRLLPEGLDLAGDGTVEQLCLSYGRLWRVNGPRNERVPEPNGYYFYPQVYQTSGLAEPAWETMPVDGPRVLAMQPVALHQRSRYVLVVRSNYLALYDTHTADWAFSWTPLVDLCAAAVVRDSEGVLQVLAFTRDQLLWQLTWEGDAAKLSAYQADHLNDDLRAVVMCDGGEGASMLCGAAGLYRRDGEGRVLRIAEGDFSDAVEMDGGVVGVMADGRVLRYEKGGRD